MASQQDPPDGPVPKPDPNIHKILAAWNDHQSTEVVRNIVRANQDRFIAATTHTLPSEPVVLGAGAQEGVAQLSGAGTLAVDAMVLSGTTAISINPTSYPDQLNGVVTVQNHITVNIYAADFQQFNHTMLQLIDNLRGLNEISPEVRGKLTGEMQAGMEILTSPKPAREWIDLLLLRPLRYIISKVTDTTITKLAAAAFEWIIRHLV